MARRQDAFRGTFLIVLLLVWWCRPVLDAHKDPPPVPELSEDTSLRRGGGESILTHFQCNRCHTSAHADLEPDGCVGCHQSILALEYEAPIEVLESWATTLSRSEMAVVDVPSLDHAGWLRPDWLAAFLQQPHDIRPFLGPSMPRLSIDETQAETLAALLSPEPTDAMDLANANASRGRALVENGTCGTCHLYDGRPIRALREEDLAPIDIRRMAPDLAEASRWRIPALLRWLEDPRPMDSHTTMPPTGFSESERRDVAAFLQQPVVRSVLDVPERLPLLTREVSHEEVEDRVFRRVCWHCHGDPDYAHGDGGPGNTGGLGFFPRRLDLSSYEGVHSGAIDENGQRYSVLAEIEVGGERIPRIVAVLWARHHEVARRPLEGLRGMPLGIPPMPLEDIQLVETWVSQGARR